MSMKKNGQSDNIHLGFSEWVDWFWDIEWFVEPQNFKKEVKTFTGVGL